MALYIPEPSRANAYQEAAIRRHLATAGIGEECKFCCFGTDDSTAPLVSSGLELQKGEMHKLRDAFNSHDGAIKHGLMIDGTRYEVMQHHGTQISGRESHPDPTQGEGVTLLKTADADTTKHIYTVAVYGLPLNSAQVASTLTAACEQVFHQQICVDHHGWSSNGRTSISSSGRRSITM